MTEQCQVHCIVRGRVQGVGFRSFVRRNAVSLGITGWVKNIFDGSVEFVAEADRARLKRFLEVIEHGNHFSHVTGMDQEWGDAAGFPGFEIEF